MNMVKTIDVKNIGHDEREQLIFPGLEELNEGDALNIIMEFNPLPLVHMLNAGGEFKTRFDKEGPDEWILNVERIKAGIDKKALFKELLKEMKDGDVSEETQKKAESLFQSIDPATLGIIEQELIREGVSHDEIRESLCDLHLKAIGDSLVSSRIDVEFPHPVNTLMEEHKIILDTLSELEAIVGRLDATGDFENMGQDLEKLKIAAQCLEEAESHHQREEDALFPMLERYDIVEPPNIMRTDHIELRKRKQELLSLAQNPTEHSFEEFRKKVTVLGEYLTKELESHIFKEDNILYQIALQLLTEEDWGDVKEQFDDIGYCSFTPIEQAPEPGVVELDLRPMPPFERHNKIFEIWNELKPGETLNIINDHDPRPLQYQFEAEYKNQFEWNYGESGPVDWRVGIKKIKGGESQMRDKVEEALDVIRPSLQADGGDVELVDVEDGLVRVRLTGACGGCPMSQMTLKAGIERVLKERVPEVKEVVSV